MRTFIAFEFDKDVKTRLGNIQQNLKNRSTKGSWTYIDNFHLTLKFLGETNIEQLNKIKNILKTDLENQTAINLCFGELGFFPGKEDLRVVWLGLEGNTDILSNINNRIESSMSELGIEKEHRGFKPHITLGRNVVFKERTVDINGMLNDYAKHKFVLDKISFIKSEEINGKRIYTPLYTHKLTLK